VNSDLG